MITAQSLLSRLYLEVIAKSIGEFVLEAFNVPSSKGVITIMVIDPKAPSLTTIEHLIFGDLGTPNTMDIFFIGANKIKNLYRRRNLDHKKEFASSQCVEAAGGECGVIAALTKDGTEVYIALAGPPSQACEAFAFAMARCLGLGTYKGYNNPYLERARHIIQANVRPIAA